MVEVVVTGEFEAWYDGLALEEQLPIDRVVDLLEQRGVAPAKGRESVAGISGGNDDHHRLRTRGDKYMAKRWNDIKHKASPAQRAESKRWAREAQRLELLDADLKSVRELLGKTQVEVAKAVEISQGQLSELERRDDHLLSTLRRYVEALGGELEVIANFGDKRIRLHGV